MTSVATIFHIPICPYSQRIEILLALEGLEQAIDFEVVDVTVPRPDWLLAKTRGTTAMPILETADGNIIKSSLVILAYVTERLGPLGIDRADPWERALERMLITHEGSFADMGYRLLLNQDPSQREDLTAQMLARYAKLDEFLAHHSPEGPFLFEDFGLAEAVFTPLFVRFGFLDYYEDFALPDEPGFRRVRAWREACLAHPASRQVSYEQVVKLYYDFARGVGSGGLVPGRTRSSFALEPSWRERPWPPRDKWGDNSGHSASDQELGLV